MKGFKTILYLIFGIISIASSLKLLIFDKNDEYVKIIGLLVFGLFLLFPLIKKDTKTDTEKFIENKNIETVIWWKRLIGFLIDFIIINFIYIMIINFIISFFDIRLDKLYNPLLLISPLVIFYYTIQEYLFQTTIGKIPFKLKVISAKSDINSVSDLESIPTFFQVLIRSLVRLLFFIDIFFFLFKRPTGLHDLVSKTLVIKK